MKTRQFFLISASLFIFLLASCGNQASKESITDTSGSRVLPPPADNSNATNPSLADTAYPSKVSTRQLKDSVRH